MYHTKLTESDFITHLVVDDQTPIFVKLSTWEKASGKLFTKVSSMSVWPWIDGRIKMPLKRMNIIDINICIHPVSRNRYYEDAAAA